MVYYFDISFKEKTINEFSVGMKIEAVDMMAPHLVCVATVAQIADSLIRVHFDGWGDDFEQWIDCQSPNIYPIGWCELVGYKLEAPKQPEQDNSGRFYQNINIINKLNFFLRINKNSYEKINKSKIK